MKSGYCGKVLNSRIGLVFLITCLNLGSPAYAGVLPAHIDFDSDVPGVPPATGGVNEPTAVIIQSGTSVLVQAASNGISTQPVVLDDGGTGNFVTWIYGFGPPVSSDVLRVEATVSFSRLFDGFFLQTTVFPGGGAVVNR